MLASSTRSPQPPTVIASAAFDIVKPPSKQGGAQLVNTCENQIAHTVSIHAKMQSHSTAKVSREESQ
jgi:hypothetical protein